MTITININTYITFVETERGREVFNTYFQNLKLDPEHHRKQLYLRDGRMKMPLWQAMEIYGPATYMGCKTSFVDNQIHIER